MVAKSCSCLAVSSGSSVPCSAGSPWCHSSRKSTCRKSSVTDGRLVVVQAPDRSIRQDSPAKLAIRQVVRPSEVTQHLCRRGLCLAGLAARAVQRPQPSFRFDNDACRACTAPIHVQTGARAAWFRVRRRGFPSGTSSRPRRLMFWFLSEASHPNASRTGQIRSVSVTVSFGGVFGLLSVGKASSACFRRSSRPARAAGVQSFQPGSSATASRRKSLAKSPPCAGIARFRGGSIDDQVRVAAARCQRSLVVGRGGVRRLRYAMRSWPQQGLPACGHAGMGP